MNKVGVSKIIGVLLIVSSAIQIFWCFILLNGSYYSESWRFLYSISCLIINTSVSYPFLYLAALRLKI